MIKAEEPGYRRRIATAQITMIISITLVLFLMGLIGLIVLHAGLLSDYVRENIGFSILIKEEVKDTRIIELKKSLDVMPYVKSSEYIPREQAAQKLTKDLGEDFVGFLGFNPLLPSIEMRIRAAYTNRDSLTLIENHLMAHPEIKEIFYQKSLVDAINNNVEKISLFLLGFSGIFLFISVVLINNTIRLSVYSKRFIIRSMQLVGATEGFIRKPLVLRSIFHGLVSAFISLLMLMILVYFSVEEIPELLELSDPLRLIILVAGLFILGVFITFFSTWFAVRKYLRIRTDLLYT